MESYRSGHNELDSKSSCPFRARGFESHTLRHQWGFSSAGRASGSQSEGRRFKPGKLHHHRLGMMFFLFVFIEIVLQDSNSSLLINDFLSFLTGNIGTDKKFLRIFCSISFILKHYFNTRFLFKYFCYFSR